jgi:hypothetical protein
MKKRKRYPLQRGFGYYQDGGSPYFTGWAPAYANGGAVGIPCLECSKHLLQLQMGAEVQSEAPLRYTPSEAPLGSAPFFRTEEDKKRYLEQLKRVTAQALGSEDDRKYLKFTSYHPKPDGNDCINGICGLDIASGLTFPNPPNADRFFSNKEFLERVREKRPGYKKLDYDEVYQDFEEGDHFMLVGKNNQPTHSMKLFQIDRDEKGNPAAYHMIHNHGKTKFVDDVFTPEQLQEAFHPRNDPDSGPDMIALRPGKYLEQVRQAQRVAAIDRKLKSAGAMPPPEENLDAIPTYADGGLSIEGYKYNSPDRFNTFNMIPSNRITMQGVPHPVWGVDDTGMAQMMYPGFEYRFPGQAVFELPVRPLRRPFMQAGGKVDETQRQIQWWTSYLTSDKYKERLLKEGFTEKNVDDEIKSRLKNLKESTAQFRYMPPTDSVLGQGSAFGVYFPKESKTIIDPSFKAQFIPSSDNSVQTEVDPYSGKVFLSDEFKPGRVASYPGFETTPVHEFGHAVEDGGFRIPAPTVKKMHRYMKHDKTKEPFIIDGLAFGEMDPSELLSRFQSTRYLLQKQKIYDARTQQFDEKVYEQMLQDPVIKNNRDFQELMEILKGDGKEKKKSFIDLMNNVAYSSGSPDEVAAHLYNGYDHLQARFGGPLRYQQGGRVPDYSTLGNHPSNESLAQFIKMQNWPTPLSKPFVDSVFRANKDLNFVQRYLHPNDYPALVHKASDHSDYVAPNIPSIIPTLAPADRYSTHLMSNSDEFVYPTVVQLPDKTLKKLSPKEAYDYAIRTGQFIKFKNEEEARQFAEDGYKVGTQVKASGGGVGDQQNQLMHDPRFVFPNDQSAFMNSYFPGVFNDGYRDTQMRLGAMLGHLNNQGAGPLRFPGVDYPFSGQAAMRRFGGPLVYQQGGSTYPSWLPAEDYTHPAGMPGVVDTVTPHSVQMQREALKYQDRQRAIASRTPEQQAAYQQQYLAAKAADKARKEQQFQNILYGRARTVQQSPPQNKYPLPPAEDFTRPVQLPTVVDRVAPGSVQMQREAMKYDDRQREIASRTPEQQAAYEQQYFAQKEAYKARKEQQLQDELDKRADLIRRSDNLQDTYSIFSPERWSREGLAATTAATPERFRWFPKDVGGAGEFVDNYLNPMRLIGKMAAGLGEAPLRAKEENSVMPYLTAVGTPLVAGALGINPAKDMINPLRNVYNIGRNAAGQGRNALTFLENDLRDNLAGQARGLLNFGKAAVKDNIEHISLENINEDLKKKAIEDLKKGVAENLTPYYQLGGEEEGNVDPGIVFYGSDNINPFYANPYVTTPATADTSSAQSVYPLSPMAMRFPKINPVLRPPGLPVPQKPKTHWGPNIEGAGALVGGMSFLGNALESGDYNRKQERDRVLNLGDSVGMRGRVSRGDYLNGILQPDKYVPVQFGARPSMVPMAQLGGGYGGYYNDAVRDVVPTGPSILSFMPTGAPAGSAAPSRAPASPSIPNREKDKTNSSEPDLSVQPNEGAQYAFNYYVNKLKQDPVIAAGIVGNLYQESRLKPHVTNDIGAFGVAQWLGPRKQAWFRYADKNSISRNDLDAQLGWVLKEPGWGPETLQAMKGVGSAGEAAKVFADQFERMAKSEANYPVRMGVAENLFRQYQARNAPSQQSTASRFQEGGEYMVTPEQLQFLLAYGGEVEFL